MKSLGEYFFACFSENVCTSKQCSAFVGRMLSLMDVSADPCSNFYDYACGGLRNREVSESNPELRVDDRIRTALEQVSIGESTSLKRRFFKQFYYDCLEYEYNFDDTQRLEKGMRDLHDKNYILNF
jgi:hypothetical protein